MTIPVTFDLSPDQQAKVELHFEYSGMPADYTFAGFTEREMVEATQLVKNPENGKMPIDCTLPYVLTPRQVECICTSIGYYYGGGAEVWLEGNSTRVTAPGYYTMIGS